MTFVRLKLLQWPSWLFLLLRVFHGRVPSLVNCLQLFTVCRSSPADGNILHCNVFCASSERCVCVSASPLDINTDFWNFSDCETDVRHGLRTPPVVIKNTCEIKHAFFFFLVVMQAGNSPALLVFCLAFSKQTSVEKEYKNSISPRLKDDLRFKYWPLNLFRTPF